MRCLLSIIALLMLGSCSYEREITDIGNNYTIELDKKNPAIEIYRSSATNRKLNGEVIRKAVGRYDTTLHFTLIGNFDKGILNGFDSTFRNDRLLRVEQYRKGIKHGDQIEMNGSEKIISSYESGVIHGFQSTYENDLIWKKSYFNHGVKDSVEYFYDSLGQVTTTFTYHFNRSDFWESHLDLERHQLISHPLFHLEDTLTLQQLQRADYLGTISFNSHSPNGTENASTVEVIHESIIPYQFNHPEGNYSYFYIIDENTCSVCDYIDKEGIWVVFFDGIELSYYELIELN